jgi:hypothetical protein
MKITDKAGNIAANMTVTSDIKTTTTSRQVNREQQH